MGNLSDIRTAIDTILQTVTELQDVQRGRTVDFAGFPCVRYYLSGVGEKDRDTFHDERPFVFTVDVVHSVSFQGDTKAASEDEFEDAVEAVLDVLARKWPLSGNADRSRIDSSMVRYEEASGGV